MDNTHDPAPPLDTRAARRWQTLAHAQALRGQAPWLHEEVGQRMVQRLSWIKQQPAAWVNWRALASGASVHAQVGAAYPNSDRKLAPAGMESSQSAHYLIAKQGSFKSWLGQLQGTEKALAAPAEDGSTQMVWANMSLHTEPDPADTVKQWHRMLAVDGFLMFSALGPDTARELRAVYAHLGWPPLSHPLTDMHDWGDLLVNTGFAEPVMDMERIVLTFPTTERALQELRGLGRNLHPARFPGLRGKAWKAQLLQAMHEQMRNSQGQIELTFEIIYGHAFKPTPRLKMSSESAISMRDMRAMLTQGRKKA
ncbi:MAG: class I SAM-dependent methyltransferase [Brachymonas sp.]